ncbi:universal stress protein [Gordonia sp. HNM0687]|uniref:Universal stress protein n=1 Tax=Gordonia mangrovi TaxID=2665643 RepID=A0A6L7GVL6_9ACTN|nr:universal stress protein [Gordonia mangrovi]MXP22685.1 universal stress protein [Gordonia mangrovi]UVF77009.1 universal stress protein [Gordonia mangrovi]
MSTVSEIVVGVDGSPSAQHAVAWAAHEAELHGYRLQLMSSYASPVSDRVPQSYEDTLRATAERDVAEAGTIAQAAVDDPDTLDISTEVASGAAIPELLSRSETAKMLVVGSRGLGAISRALLGSVSAAMTAHCRCPLAVIRDSRSAPETAPIVVGTDGSRANRPALEFAFEEAGVRKVGLTVLHAWADGDLALVHASQGLPVWDWPTQRKEEKARLDAEIADLCAKYPDVPIRSVVVRDRPVRALLDHAQAAQMVVVGSRGRGGFSGMLLGSTSRNVVYSAQCPVVIVPDAR